MTYTPRPKKPRAVVHHPALGFELYDALAMDLHAVTFADLALMDFKKENARLRETLQGIANANWRKWDEPTSAQEFVDWAQSRARHVLKYDAGGEA